MIREDWEEQGDDGPCLMGMLDATQRVEWRRGDGDGWWRWSEWLTRVRCSYRGWWVARRVRDGQSDDFFTKAERLLLVLGERRQGRVDVGAGLPVVASRYVCRHVGWTKQMWEGGGVTERGWGCWSGAVVEQ